MLKKKIPSLLSIILLLLFTACESLNKPKFAVAANLLFPMQEIKTAYEVETGNSFDLISGSSGVLSAQIQNGAPFDLFFSADMKYPEAIYQAGLAEKAPIVIIRGRSIFWSKYSLEDQKIAQYLKSGKVKTLAIANPELAPYGAQAKKWLMKQNFWSKWNDQLIVGENVGQVNQYIRLESVDAAFTAISSMHAVQLKDIGHWYMLDSIEDMEIPHGLVLLPHASPSCEGILSFLQTNKAQQIFQKYGYLGPYE